MKSAFIKVTAIVATVIILNQCEYKKDFQTELPELNDNSFIMQAERQAKNAQMHALNVEIEESHYVPLEEFVQYHLNFSGDGQSVTIIFNDQTMSGQLQKTESDFRKYNLTEGTFAGGRFNVWVNQDHFEFELTFYGSGVPIAYSVRGRLIPA